MRTQQIFPVLLSALLTLTACKSEPQLNGDSLVCSRDATCPDGFRCYEGGCIINSAPEIAPLDSQMLALGDSLALTVTASDAEGDTIAFRWTQLDGPEALLVSTLDDATLLATPTVVGGFTFEVIANDGYVDSVPLVVHVSVIAVPSALDVVYVSKLGDDEESCGTLTHPCLTIAAGLAARTSTAVPLLIARRAGVAYHECLNLTDDAVLIGGFDEDVWVYDATTDDTDVSCEVTGGHVISAAATLRNLMLSSIVATAGALEQTLLVTNAAPILEDVAIQAPGCEGCVAVGLHNDGGSPQLIRTNVRGAPLIEFEFPSQFIGVLSRGGAPVITGERVDGEVARGRILLNTPTNFIAIGVLGMNSNVGIHDVRIAGGAAPQLFGFAFSAGAPLVEGSDIALSSFNTRVMYGLAYRSCDSNTWDCVCLDWPHGCPTALSALPIPTAITAHSPTFENNVVDLTGTADAEGLLVCMGIGLYAESASPGATSHITGNTVTIGDKFTLAAGGVFGGSLSHPSTPTVENNTIAVGSGVSDVLCRSVNERTMADFPSGTVGLYVGNTKNGVVQDNNISVAGHEYVAYGVLAEQHESATIERNRIDVGSESPTTEGLFIVGAALGTSSSATANSESSFARNEILVRRGAPTTVGLHVAGLAHSIIDNNFIFGGRAKYTVGLQLAPSILETEWPKVRHNTIHGGGDSTNGLTSAAVRLVGEDPSIDGPQPASGVFENNLLDAGFAPGRRFVFDNGAEKSFVASASGNVAQFDQTIVGPEPTTPFVSSLGGLGGAIGNADGAEFLYVVLPNTGEVAYVAPDASVTYLTIGGAFPLGDRVVASWAGASTLLVATTQSVFVSSVSVAAGYVERLDPYSTVTARGEVVTPTSLVLASLRSEKLTTEIILLASDDGGTQRLWRMPSDGAGGYGAPVEWTPTVGTGPLTAAPVYLSRGEDPSKLILLDDAGMLHLWGISGATSDAVVSLDFRTPLQAIWTTNGWGTLPTVLPVDQLFGTDFREDLPSYTGVTQDLVAIVDGTLLVWRNVSVQAGLTTPRPIRDDGGAGYVPCTRAAALAAVGSLDNGTSSQKEMAVSCNDGAVELYAYNITFNRLERSTTPYDGGTVASGLAITSNSGIFATQAGTADEIHLYTVTAYAISDDIALALIPDVAQRDTTRWQEQGDMVESPVDVGVNLHHPTDLPMCGLALHAARATSYDLHLTGIANAENACIDAGDPAVVLATDFDGDNRDATPDVGADEVP